MPMTPSMMILALLVAQLAGGAESTDVIKLPVIQFRQGGKLPPELGDAPALIRLVDGASVIFKRGETTEGLAPGYTAAAIACSR